MHRPRLATLAAIVFALACHGCPAPAGSADAGDGGVREAGLDATRDTADSGVFDEANIPPAQSEELTLRMRHLLEAIAQDNPDLAKDVVFPRDAWIAVKDGSDPGKTWEPRLLNAFKKAVHRSHKRRKHMDRAKFVSFELGRHVSLAPPKRRDLKKSVWRVKRSKIGFSIDDRQATLEIAEMTAYKGAWYVTRLR